MIDIFADEKEEWLALSEREQQAMIAYLFLLRTSHRVQDCADPKFLQGMFMWTIRKDISAFTVPMKYHKLPVEKLKKHFPRSMIKQRKEVL